jgi:16S rRNA (cytosine1402-N4)-methyltransferase
VGSAGHALEIAKRIKPNGRLIVLDQDPAAIVRAQKILGTFDSVSYHIENFKNLENVLDCLNIPLVDAVILDVGFSSDQLEDAGRGFSFEREGPLDMRMNPSDGVTARDLVNNLSQTELERIFWEYGEERWGRKFARVICESRRNRAIETTQDLVRVIQSALPDRFWTKKHPAMRIFQALRIAVNDELGVLKDALPKIWGRLKRGGRLAVISFHSLEDRIIKHQFRVWQNAEDAVNLTRKPIVASAEELSLNSRARSAKLRAVEKK